MGEVILTMKDIDKSFPGVHALDHVNFEVKRGEVHALMGENGAGKSTLMKVLTGIYQKDSGSITYKGKEVEFHNTREAQDAGVVIVHQELNMVGDLTVAQNIFIGREPKKGFRIDDKKMIEDSKKLFQDLNIEIDPREKMQNLTVGKQQMCEIAKAISHKAEVIIFDDTIAGNIAYGCKDKVTREQIERAAEAAALTDWLATLPDGLDTQVGNAGNRLSGGQRQRISIARAFLKDAKILLLDEATSALDAESERYIQESLKSLMQGRTSFVVAHRLSTIRDADRIVVMNHGKVHETGTHSELLKLDGEYAHLCRLQQLNEAQE